jgi:hypothetical protein
MRGLSQERPAWVPKLTGEVALEPPRAGRERQGIRRLFTITLPAGSGMLVLIAVLALAIVLLDLLPASFSVDSWLELVAGRYIWQNGLPHHETLTVIAHGARWVDQQWLGQLLSYGLDRLGGFGLLGLVNVAMMVGGVGAAVIAASRRGARLWVVLLVFALCLCQIVPSHEVRTQAFAIPLIVATVLLLSSDSRRSSARVYWCLPLLMLWANLHGTAALGAGLVSLRGITLAGERRRAVHAAWACRGPARLRAVWSELRRPLALAVGAPCTLLMTPYGLETLSYYRATMMNSALRHAVTEWQPITSAWLEAVPFFLLAALAVWLFGRRPGVTTTWEKLALLALAAGSIDVIRNALLFGLAALVILPAALDSVIAVRTRREVPDRRKLNAALAWSAIAIVAVAATWTVIRPRSAFEQGSRLPRLAAAVRSATEANPSLRVLADVRFADWLLWADPQLQGRLANDARFELLSPASTVGLERVFFALGPDWKRAARGYRLLVLDRPVSPDAVRGFLAEPGHRVLFADGPVIVILRSARAAAA